jgi:hypothetical protein
MKEKTLETINSLEEAVIDLGVSEEREAMKFLVPDLEESLDPDASNAPGTARFDSASPRNEIIYILASNGMKYGAIAQELAISTQTVSRALNLPEAKLRIAYHQERLFGKSVRKRMDALAHKAVDNLTDLLDSHDDKTLAKATMYVLDQSVGKAKQTIQHEGSMISDLIDTINNAREVKEIALEHQKPKDQLESFIDKFVPDHTVGVRNREKK